MEQLTQSPLKRWKADRFGDHIVHTRLFALLDIFR
jgi:hypothetical protein